MSYFQVFSGCGKPTLGRRRRSSKPPGELSLETLEFERGGASHYDNGEGGAGEAGLSLDKLVKDIRTRVKDTKPVSYTHLDVYKRQEQTSR